jgi:hypothetical protein
LGLLQGPPGTGKTLFIASLVHYARRSTVSAARRDNVAFPLASAIAQTGICTVWEPLIQAGDGSENKLRLALPISAAESANVRRRLFNGYSTTS